MTNPLSAPQADTMIHRAASVPASPDDNTKELILALLQKLQAIAVCGEDERRELWITARRGSIEDFGDYEDALAVGDVESWKEFRELWLSEYPEPQKWYLLAAQSYEDTRYIFLDGELTFQIQPGQPGEYYLDWSELARWLLSAVDESINALKAGTYNAHVNAYLPYRKRVGKILRENYWDIFAGEKEAYLQDITPNEIKRFAELMDGQLASSPASRLPEMTAGLFFDCCRLGYEANCYKGAGDLTPRELYRAYADGRHDGLLDLDEQSAEAFDAWFHDKTIYGGHPWEVCRGGNSTHISLYPACDERGWWLSLAGSSHGRSVETIKFYLALSEHGLPVQLRDGRELEAMLNGRDYIGIVPEGVIPHYCDYLFSDEKMLSYMNLSWENTGTIVKAAFWYPLKEVRLAGD
ncbi:MAG: hypothetical protein LBU32_11045 [Clostridiales bacterium]|jgi:hypothetical protein|nr:hypothetical protein [Clostridiales bacterium]